ncbi:MAG: LPS export ABC transporter periplasmic protein LptC [Algoriphagus sp. 32-45-6]|nr:MAG: LPS export ABC transporter periplasmic protein LptC [Algoriphagus sp. 32-45-6]
MVLQLMHRLFLMVFVGLVLGSCRPDADLDAILVYEGPINEAFNVNLVQSDSAKLRAKLKAPHQLKFANGNEEFPEGIEIEMYASDGSLETTMRADRGYFIKETNLYRGEGNVQIRNLIKDQSLKTEEIFWNQIEKKIYTEKFVTIQEKQTLFNGTGMEADDSFANYTLKQVRDSRTILPGEGL